MNKLIFKPKAIKQLAKIPEQQRIREKCNTLKEFPYCQNVKALTNHQYDYRLRVGNYRVFFNYGYNETINIVSIEEVKKRDENTY
ncbi:cytotoxic translational repressor of toxin-antitoxin stability system [Pasteurellaceae bacterium 15-036681]|nr:cytotoxic translational repressor of toxin-antitoxin stability system [Pasteurellaceae bacterium 15-036681]